MMKKSNAKKMGEVKPTTLISSKHLSKKLLKSKVIESLGTKRNYAACLKLYIDWCQINEIQNNRKSDQQNLVNYLEEKAEIYQQKTLCQHRMALNMAYHKKLKFVPSLLDTVIAARDYKFSEILEIIKNISAKNAIAILICYYAGLRAHEIATIQRFHEGKRSETRKWSDSLFDIEVNYTIHLVTGKGGLCRYVAIPNELSEIIEERRFDKPIKVTDRGIFYQLNYDLGFGKALSQCFSRASLKALGWSTGLHGTRHSYAKNRVKKLVDCHYTLDEAKLIVSQELGHFRPNIVNCYLR